MQVGANEILIVVTAQDKITTRTYTLTVTRAPSSDATLQNLALSDGALTPTFMADTFAYEASVAHSTNSVTVTVTVNESNATVTGGGEHNLQVGANEILIVVTAEDKTTTRTYTLTVTRAPSSDATLRSLELSSGALTPDFMADTLTYATSVAHATTFITVTAAVNEPNATVTGGGGHNLQVGANEIEVVVTAEDAATKLTYTLTVTRAPFVAGDDASLRALTISPGQFAETFAADTRTYTAAFANNVTEITVTPTPNDAKAKVTVDNNPLTSGGASAPIALAANVARRIVIVVTAEDALAMRTYIITATRAPGRPGLPQNNRAEPRTAALQVNWDAPLDENGSAVTGYKIRWRLMSAPGFAPEELREVTNTMHRIADLRNEETYALQVAAVNAVGDGEWSNTVTAAPARYDLDVDASDNIDARDGIIIARYLLGVRGDTLLAGQSAGDAQSAEERVASGAENLELDVDANQTSDAKDGILILRYMLGLRGESLTAEIADADAATVQMKMETLLP